MDTKSRKHILYRISFIFLIPACALLSVYHYLSSYECIPGTEATPETVNALVSQTLQSHYENIQALAPLVQFGSAWFLFDVSVENSYKVAIVITEPAYYSTIPTTFTFQTKIGTSTISTGQHVIIASKIQEGQIQNLVTQMNLSAGSSTMNLLWGPHAYMEFQTNPALGNVCAGVNLDKTYWFFIYLEIWAFWIGFIILLKESLTFINRGRKKYFTSM